MAVKPASRTYMRREFECAFPSEPTDIVLRLPKDTLPPMDPEIALSVHHSGDPGRPCEAGELVDVSYVVRTQSVALVKPEALLVERPMFALDVVKENGQAAHTSHTHTHTHTFAHSHTSIHPHKGEISRAAS